MDDDFWDFDDHDAIDDSPSDDSFWDFDFDGDGDIDHDDDELGDLLALGYIADQERRIATNSYPSQKPMPRDLSTAEVMGGMVLLALILAFLFCSMFF